MKNLDNKIQILNENRGETSLYDYIESTSQSDPNFFRWLFDEDFENDFDSSMTDEQKQEFTDWLQSIRAKELLEKWIVVQFPDADEDAIRVTRRENFVNMNFCDAYGNYGKKVECYDAGCYSFENSASSIFEDFYVAISDRFGIGSLMDDNELTHSELVDLLKAEDDTEIFPEFSKMVEFFKKWREENETHTEVKGWTYNDSHNFKTVVLEADFGEPDCVELDEDEQIAILLQMPEPAPYIEGTSISEETEDYTFYFDRWATNPWFCYVERK